MENLKPGYQVYQWTTYNMREIMGERYVQVIIQLLITIIATDFMSRGNVIGNKMCITSIKTQIGKSLDWFKAFMLRHRNLTIKLAENTKRVRAAVSYEGVKAYCTELKESLKDIFP
ncbi:hypothetical protein NQ317_018970 [Molorchus minor]|uniref:Uncharacterized protein n=1 Tax=Molorchus minor TaxID=1323400 RepID=A0ABQ9JJH0_9CUCU|nr:hypothetical protein NQ317_018970 [Molorchus minor]